MSIAAVDARTLKSWIDAGEAVIVDVREPGEFASGHIPGAVAKPLGRIGSIDPALLGRARVVFVCASGARSGRACEAVKALPIEAYSLAGGLAAWRGAGGMLVGATRSVLPLDRQVQIGAGGLALAGFLLGVFVHPGFHFVSGFVGAGLVFAGLSGFCGMARVLALAPWNKATA